MTTLHDRLSDLAGDAPPGGPAPDLWERGRRYHRRRRAGTVVIAAVAVVALVALSALSWSSSRSQVEPVPAGPRDGMRLPDHFYDPSRWLPTTHEEGPLGRLVAVMGSEGGLVGVSATSGEYRRLDLRGWSDLDSPLGSSDVALSADGRRVGYWYVEDGRVVGLGSYDAGTDRVTRHALPSEFGLGPNGLAWIGDRLWISAYAFDDETGTSGRQQATIVWTPATGATEDVPLGRSPSFGNETTAGDRVVEQDEGGVAFYSPDVPPRSLRVGPSFSGAVPVSDGDGRLAVLLDPEPSSSDTRPLPVAVLTPDGQGGTTAQRVPHLRTNQMVAWRDGQHLVVWTYTVDAYQSVDVETGAARTLTTSGTSWTPGLHVASDAWAAPTYDAAPPPRPTDPRLVDVAVVAVGVLAVVALLLWRRRVRP